RTGLPWLVSDNREVILTAVEIFGAHRSMFASNFPVDRLCGSFQTIYAGFREIVSGFVQTDREKMFYSNAARIYRLPEPAKNQST
ncbi:MAG: amidohydrolase family protein, partial [Gammaproteobacteria bacterium]|nr:amidohydrolase family protein [Gammaproteobacteria bacterium]